MFGVFKDAPNKRTLSGTVANLFSERGDFFIPAGLYFLGEVWYDRGMVYCISDIHGHYELFCRLLDKLKFGGGDRMYVLGDIVGKGAESIRLAKLLFSLDGVFCIAGNHEYDMLKRFRALTEQTGDFEEALDILRCDFEDGHLLDAETVEGFDSLPFYIETDELILVHAGVPLAEGKILPLREATREQLVYDRRFKDADVLPMGGKCVLYGHTPVRYLTGRDEILFYPREGAGHGSGRIADYCKIHLDTGVYLGGVLGCVETGTCRCTYVRAL